MTDGAPPSFDPPPLSLAHSRRPGRPRKVATAEELEKKVTTEYVNDHLRIGIDSLKELQNTGISVKHLKY
jgi:AMP nucleosidase